jgi:hypothetical protein
MLDRWSGNLLIGIEKGNTTFCEIITPPFLFLGLWVHRSIAKDVSIAREHFHTSSSQYQVQTKCDHYFMLST